MTDNALNDIGFTEFTAKLVTDVFEALVDANLTQMEAYSALSSATQEGLTTYINNTKNDVPTEAILDFLTEKFPSATEGGKLTASDAKGLNALLTNIKKTEAKENSKETQAEVVEVTTYETNTKLTSGGWDKLLDNVASVISQNKYSLLQEMVKQGMLRLVVDNGTIETRLNFDVSSERNTNIEVRNYTRDNFKTKRKGRISGRLFGFGGSTSTKSTRKSLRVTTAKMEKNGSDKISTKIFGGVTINFSTDYLKLSDES